jgi:hypothetical protein
MKFLGKGARDQSPCPLPQTPSPNPIIAGDPLGRPKEMTSKNNLFLQVADFIAKRALHPKRVPKLKLGNQKKGTGEYNPLPP